MTKTARWVVLLWLVAPLGACGSSDGGGDESADAEPEARASTPAPRAPAVESNAPATNSSSNAEPVAPAIDPTATPDDVDAPAADAEFTPSGLASKRLSEGTGQRHPAATDTVSVNYSGWTTDGVLFDSSYNRGRPSQFPLNGVIRGWTEGLQLMVVGERRRFWIPAALAYGTNPAPDKPRGMLVFDVELVAIVSP